MPRIHFTPWKEQSELFSLCDKFYPPPSYTGPDMRESACSLVSVWKVRGNLPPAVEATALLTTAVLHDDARTHSIYSIQATYSTAFCRFVTALVDKSVHGRKQSMYHMAAEIGIPASFVELRHEATHRDMPSLVTLQRAAQRALEWLWRYYWAGIEDAASPSAGVDTPSSPEDSRFAKDAVRKLVEPVVARASGPTVSIKERRLFERDSGVPIARELARMCRGNRGTSIVAQVLLEEDIMVPKSSVDNQLTTTRFSTWDQVLLTLCHHHAMFLTTFVEEAVRILNSSSAPDKVEDDYSYQHGLFKWLERILSTSNTWTGPRRQYLVPSYAQTLCKNTSGYWTDRLRPLLGELRKPTEHSPGDTDMDGEENATRARGGRTRQENLNDDEDIAALHDYGWSIRDTRTSKPIGVI